jgi:hypothetical protein
MGEWRHRSSCRRRQPLLQDGIGSLRSLPGVHLAAIPSPATFPSVHNLLWLPLATLCALVLVAWMWILVGP